MSFDQLRYRKINETIAVLLNPSNGRREAVAKLRELCAEFGDNDWPDEIPLLEVIDKHLPTWLDIG